ncbi:Uncharacterized conserved protein, DUF1330 family [Pseudovibrio ascidiaceicola]|uniref:Uncharacterized conserved protein, DUF1330 family n=1 Tax=Pseudovibrio ascidiaceicola TaxID=285279 RepID=A0A1I3VBD1_9HYPH|nr:DUF1330 domain-containing protein [Pseudovibrio ascidiaceicola]SFJ91497.1 Uncharacterized conserved protein, DUF1330 family [Pseudovibrio ascidiaceicola]
MPAYMISWVRVEDTEVHSKDYLPNAHAILTRHGGKALSIVDNLEATEGNLPDGRFILMEFPTKAHAEGFYNDEEYQPLKALRHTISNSDMAIFDEGLIA